VLRRVVAEVVPVVGLLAETTEAGRLAAADVEALRVLAGLPAGDRAVLRASVDLFASRACPVPRGQRRRLLDLLDLYGIGFCLALLAARPQRGSGDLVRMVSQASGFQRLRDTLDHSFRWRTDAIKAGWALSTLEKVAGGAGPEDREVLRDAIERVRRRCRMTPSPPLPPRSCTFGPRIPGESRVRTTRTARSRRGVS
jgi:hypothetical protein